MDPGSDESDSNDSSILCNGTGQAVFHADDDEAFDQWLDGVGQHYQRLPDRKKVSVLERLLSISNASQLVHVSQIVPSMVLRDFVKLLPRELCVHLLSYLDGLSLLKCCQVSGTWNYIINRCPQLWLKVCKEVGAKVPKPTASIKCEGDDDDDGNESDDDVYEVTQSYKRQYQKVCQFIQDLDRGVVLRETWLEGHRNRVMAMYYWNGILATGSDEHTVKLWDMSTGECMKTLQTHTVSCLKFDDNFVFTGSFDDSVACWIIHSGRKTCQYIGHVSAVFSLDFDIDLDLLITGAADRTSKLWQVSTGVLLHTFDGIHKGWVVEVKILKSKILFNGVTCTVNKAGISSFYSVQVITACSGMLCQYDITDVKNIKPILTTRLDEFRCQKFCPKFIYHNSNIYAYVTGAEASSIWTKDLFKRDSAWCEIPVPRLFSILLGVGEHFALFVTIYDKDETFLVELHTGKILALINLGPCRPSFSGSTFTMGSTDWLDGIAELPTYFCVAVCKNNMVMVLNWDYMCRDQVHRQIAGTHDASQCSINENNTEKLNVEPELRHMDTG